MTSASGQPAGPQSQNLAAEHHHQNNYPPTPKPHHLLKDEE